MSNVFFEDTMKDPKGHFLRQRAFKCDAISVVPEPMWALQFVNRDVTEADRHARLLSKLRLTDEKLAVRLKENADRLDRLRDVLGNLKKSSSSATRSISFSVVARGSQARKDRR